MDHAKRMVLVDENLVNCKPMLSHFQEKQDLAWKRPTEQVVKSSASRQMKATLDDTKTPEDIKAKRHRQHLNRFLQTKRKASPVSATETPLIDLGPTVDELLDIKDSDVKTTTKRRSKRVKKKPKRYADITWDEW